MGKKKKISTKPDVEVTPIPQQEADDLTGVIEQASLDLQLKRHQSIGQLFDKAADVVGSYLDDPNLDTSSKMLPAKLAIDLFTTQEKFKREDERIEIEKRKLLIEEKKANIPSLPGGSTFNQQNNYFPVSPEQIPDLAEIKRKQEELLASHRPKKPVKIDDSGE